VTNITKENRLEYFNNNKYYDCVINANGNSRKFWANNNPLDDFELSTKSVYESLLRLRYNKYIYISSVDAGYNNYYGLNKKLSEDIVKFCAKNYTILRCSAIIGKNMKKGILKDIIDGNKVYITPNSQYQFITNTEIAKIINKLLYISESKTLEVGGVEAITVSELAYFLKKPIVYSDKLETLVYNQDITELCKYYNIKTSKEYIMEALSERVD
jgi:dTDP-4-dehydrorhamnose reductase